LSRDGQVVRVIIISVLPISGVGIFFWNIAALGNIHARGGERGGVRPPLLALAVGIAVPSAKPHDPGSVSANVDGELQALLGCPDID
jgi:hypothetical protein